MTDTHIQTYTVQVEADSLIDFDASFVDVEGYNVEGQPLSGKNGVYFCLYSAVIFLMVMFYESIYSKPHGMHKSKN